MSDIEQFVPRPAEVLQITKETFYGARDLLQPNVPDTAIERAYAYFNAMRQRVAFPDRRHGSYARIPDSHTIVPDPLPY